MAGVLNQSQASARPRQLTVIFRLEPATAKAGAGGGTGAAEDDDAAAGEDDEADNTVEAVCVHPNRVKANIANKSCNNLVHFIRLFPLRVIVFCLVLLFYDSHPDFSFLTFIGEWIHPSDLSKHRLPL